MLCVPACRLAFASMQAMAVHQPTCRNYGKHSQPSSHSHFLEANRNCTALRTADGRADTKRIMCKGGNVTN
jgi:hypothetical protein